MSKIRSILRCYKTGNGIKRTSVLAGASKNTVKKYIHIYQKCGYGIEDLLKMEDSQLCDIFQEKKTEPIPLTDKEKALQKEMPDYIKKLSIIDTITGESIQVETFVAILPCSQLTYIEAVMSQKKEDFIKRSSFMEARQRP